MKKTILMSAVFLFVCPAQAFAQTPTTSPAPTQKGDTQLYISANLGGYGFSGTGNGETLTSDGQGAAFIRGGAKFAKYFGVEGEAGLSLGDIPAGTNFDLGLDYQIAGYGLIRVPIGKNNRDKADLFLKLGYHVSEFSIDIGNQSESRSEDGFAFGLGGNYFFRDDLGIRVEISSFGLSDDFFNNANDNSYLGGSLGLVMRF